MWCNILTSSKCIIAVVRKPVFCFPDSNIEEVFACVLSPTWRMVAALHFLFSLCKKKEHREQDRKVIRSFLCVSIWAASPHEHTVLVFFFCRPCPSPGYNLAPIIVAHSEGLSERQRKAPGSRHWDAELFPGLHITNGHHSSPCWTPKDLSLLLAGDNLMSLTCATRLR